MNNYILISILSFIAFISYVIYEYGVLPSISDFWYKAKSTERWKFSLFLLLLSIPLMIQYQKPLVFVACSCICAIGMYPWFKLKSQEKLHSIFAYSGIALSSLSLIIDYRQYAYVGMLVLFEILIEFLNITNKTWWQEIIAIILILTGLSQIQVT